MADTWRITWTTNTGEVRTRMVQWDADPPLRWISATFTNEDAGIVFGPGLLRGPTSPGLFPHFPYNHATF